MIWACGNHFIQEYLSTVYNRFTWVKVEDTYICSVYVLPSLAQKEFVTMFDKLTNELQGRSTIIVAGDFNAWAANWGSRFTNQRGETLLEAFVTMVLILTNKTRLAHS